MSTLTVQTLQAPTSGANANKVIIPSTNSLYAPNHIVQVLTQEITAYTATSSTSAVATGFTLTITPKSTASKIRCTVGLCGFFCNSVNTAGSIYLHKNGSFVKYLHSVAGYANPAAYSTDPIMQVTDSPSTTSAVTYAIFWKRNSGSANVNFNNYGTANNETRSWYTVEEIAQ
tara:strand:- start:50 stop:568 length:519 start_codon:yes stop_codon:yes gene_type:complete